MASEVASETVEQVVNAVLESYELTVLLRVRNRPIPSLTLTEAIAAQGLEVMDTIPYEDHRGETLNLTHIKVIKQFVPNLCGYHSLYNVLEAARYLKLKNPNRIWKVTHSPSFWKFHFRTSAFISEECLRRGDQNYWTVKNARHGDLERCFFSYLRQANSHILQHFESSRDFISQLHNFSFQFNEVKMSRQEVEKMQEAFDLFLSTGQECVMGFMMGVTNHWVSLVAHKVGGFREFLFLDSRNANYLRYDEQAIIRHYEEVATERLQRGQKPLTSFELYVAHQGMKDIQQALNILMSCLVGKTTLQQVVVSYKLQHLLQNFEEVPGDSTISKLETFFEMGFPAKFIYDDYVAHLLSYPSTALTATWRNRLSVWVQDCDTALKLAPQASWEAKYFHQLVISKLKNYLSKLSQ